jgi:UDP-N-acetylmuramoyl-L-alanyl-D-glutamate--2,6-diaminopimelate ligase
VLHTDPGDTILLAGKGHETYEITSDGKHPFHEEEIVREAANERLGRPEA